MDEITLSSVNNWINEKKLMSVKKRTTGDLEGIWSYGFIVTLIDQNLLVYDLDRRSVMNVNLIDFDIAPCSPRDWKYKKTILPYH
ncbi:hypothetical protein SAMN03159332_6136 [Paenibacillus sp. 276b]|nr:hypothetical protein SAMN03159332_6136 [Paenibacillus sp. 276b]